MGKYNEIRILEGKLYSYNKEIARVQNIENKNKTMNHDNLERFFTRKIIEIKKHLKY